GPARLLLVRHAQRAAAAGHAARGGARLNPVWSGPGGGDLQLPWTGRRAGRRNLGQGLLRHPGHRADADRSARAVVVRGRPDLPPRRPADQVPPMSQLAVESPPVVGSGPEAGASSWLARVLHSPRWNASL